MKTRIQKWGKSLAVRIPKSVAAEAGIGENAPVSLSVDNRKLVIEPVAEASLKLDDLLGVGRFRLPTPGAVRTYLEEHPDLAYHLSSICDVARKEFGPEAELSLEMYSDPEIHDQYLTLYIRLDSYQEDTLARIDAVSRRFDKHLEQASGDLVLTTDFRAPRG